MLYRLPVVVVMQRLARGRLGRKKAQNQRLYWKSRREKEEWAAVYVQRHVRSLIARRVLQRLRRDEDLRNQAALWIQSRWRAHRGRLGAHLLKAARQQRREWEAAVLVQTLWRGKAGRNRLSRMKSEKAKVVMSQNQAAASMQAVFRGMKDRRVVRELKRQNMMAKLKLEDLFGWGALTIQKNYRGYVSPRCCRDCHALMRCGHLQ